MKKIIITVVLSFVWLMSFATFIYAQTSTNEELIDAIDAVLSSNQPKAVKALSAKKLIKQLKEQYEKVVNDGSDSAIVKKTTIESYKELIAEYEGKVGKPADSGMDKPDKDKPKENAGIDADSASFPEVPRAGTTQVNAKGKSGGKYKIFLNDLEVGEATGDANGNITKQLVQELKPKTRVTIKPIVDGEAVDGKAVSEQVASLDNPTDGGIFGVLVGGAVFSQQNQNYGQSSPFFGFNTGYYSKVHGVKTIIGKVDTTHETKSLTTTSNDTLTDSTGIVWRRDLSDISILKYKNDDNAETITVAKEKYGKDDNGFQKLKVSSPLKSFRFNLRFQGIFEADGRTATGKEDATPATPTTPASNPNPFQFVASQQTFTTQAEAWMEFRPMRQFSFGPYFSVGASALVDKSNAEGGTKFVRDNGKSSTITKLDTDLKKFYEVGTMVNLRFDAQKFFLQSIFAYGNYEQYKDLDLNPLKPTDAGYNPLFKANDTRKRFVAKLRVFPEGLFGNKPITPMFGVDLNAGNGPDHLRFFTGFAIRLKGIDVADAVK
jgi:hypothetical protein